MFCCFAWLLIGCTSFKIRYEKSLIIWMELHLLLDICVMSTFSALTLLVG